MSRVASPDGSGSESRMQEATLTPPQPSQADYEHTESKEKVVESQPPPEALRMDGGLQAWLTVLGAFLVQFASGFLNSFGVFQDFFVADFLSDFSSSQISWIGSISTFIVLAGGVVSGRLFDAGYFYAMMIIGSALAVFCVFMFTLAEKQQYYQVFLSLGLGFGIGLGLIYVPSIAVCSHYFRRKRALAMGIVSSGSSLGAMLFPIMINNLIHGKVGFANGVRASGGLLAGPLLIAVLITRARKIPSPNKGQAGLWAAAKKFARDEAYICAVLATFMVVQGFYFPLFYIQLYCDQHGINQTFSFYALTIINAGSFLGRLVGGAVVNRFGAFNSIAFSSFAMAVTIFAILGLQSIAGVVIWALVYGFFSGAYITLLGPLWASLATDVSEIGARIGIAYGFTGLGALIATPITGALLSRSFHWWRPIIYVGVVNAFGGVLFTVGRFIVVHRKKTTIV